MPFLKHGEPSVLPSCFQPSAVLVIAPIAKWKIENIGKKNKKRHRCCLQWKYFARSCKSNWLDWAWQFSLCTFSCAWEDCGSNSIHLGPFSSQQSGVNVFLFSWRLPYRAKKSRTKCRICINKWTVFTTGLIWPNMIVWGWSKFQSCGVLVNMLESKSLIGSVIAQVLPYQCIPRVGNILANFKSTKSRIWSKN